MNRPLLHPRTEASLNSYFKEPSHGLILSGETGTGKLYLAKWIASKLQSQEYIVTSLEDKSTISIEQIRQLYSVTRTGNGLTVIIENSQTLGSEAQNAFLKLLEEPPKDTRFILTASSALSLLPTIQSRSQLIEVYKPNKKLLLKLGDATSDLSQIELESLVHTSKGLPGTFLKLVAEESLRESHQTSVNITKTFYTAKPYARHILCIENKYDKQWSEQLLDILSIILESLLKQGSGNQKMFLKLKKQSELIETTSRNLLTINGNPKIHLAKLCEQL